MECLLHVVATRPSLIESILRCVTDCKTYLTFVVDEDEDGDRITVRSDDEMQGMFSYVSATPTPSVLLLPSF